MFPDSAEGRAIATIPTNPTMRPAIWRRPGSWRSRTEAMIAVKIGTAPLSIPATAESIHCWAIGKSVSGIATQTTARSATRGRSSRRIGVDLARGIIAMKRAPNPTLSQVTRPGWNASSPTSMKRNEAPQMRPIETKRAQSRPVNASRLVPWAVESRRLVISLEHRSPYRGCAHFKNACRWSDSPGLRDLARDPGRAPDLHTWW